MIQKRPTCTTQTIRISLRSNPMKKTITNPILKERVTFIKTAAETNGEVTQLEISLMPGGGNTLHYHTDYTETFTALEGELGIELAGGQKIYLKPMQSHIVAMGELSRFFNPGTQQIVFRNDIYPGHQGLEYTLRIMFGLASDGLYNKENLPSNFMHLAICGVMSGMRLPGLMELSIPLFRIVAWWARITGAEKRLIEKYCV